MSIIQRRPAVRMRRERNRHAKRLAKLRIESMRRTPTHPLVTVTDVTETSESEIPQAIRRIDLGDYQVTRQLTALLTAHKQSSRKTFRLQWNGNKIPRGAEIEGKKVAWTQNGMVTDEDGRQIGTYERTIEFGGESRQEQEMLVFVL